LPDTSDIDSLDFTQLVQSGETVAWGQGAAEPLALTKKLMLQRREIGQFNVFIGYSNSETANPAFTDCVTFFSYCGGGTNQHLAREGKLNIIPSGYFELVGVLKESVDVLLVQVAPSDKPGCYSLGVAYDYVAPLVSTARLVVAEVNDQSPFTFGEREISDQEIDILIRTSRPLFPSGPAACKEQELAVARKVADLIGSLPEGVVRLLSDRRNLGIHSGAIGDAVGDLMRAGIITNALKNIDAGKTVAGLMLGSPDLYNYAHRNHAIAFRSVLYTHAAEVLAQLDRFVAINSAVEVDLTGQINAEIAAGNYVGAVGGAGNFLRGALRSPGGLPIVALPATSGPNHSRIVAHLSGPVSTPRSDAGLIVTEFGIADLRGRSLSQRIKNMISIADPKFRDLLLKQSAGIRG
jgi:acyl-CoA hydrolase